MMQSSKVAIAPRPVGVDAQEGREMARLCQESKESLKTRSDFLAEYWQRVEVLPQARYLANYRRMARLPPQEA